MIFFPNWAYFNIYAMSSWTRTIVIPLSIFYAYKPVRKLPDRLGIKELFVSDEANGKKARRWLTWHNFFTLTDKAIKYLEPPQQNVAGNRWQRWFWHARRQLREKAVRHAAAWLLEHFEDSDGVGAIFPPMIYTVIVLRCLGYSDDSPEMRYAMKQLDDLKIEEGDTLRLQPCLSPVWDTTLTMNALADAILDEGSAVEDHATILHALERATRWLLEKEVRRRGDWSVMNPRLEPGGWFFEYRNGFYPDTDDTAMALMALAKTERARYRSYALEPSAFRQQPVAAAAERALRWLLAMQNDDGGWAAFDRNINREVLTKIPFADHNAMLDPSCPDITARVLEALGHYGFDARHPQVQNAIRFLERTQDRDGCWTGRWGVNYIYGAWQVLQGFKQIGYDMHSPVVRRAVRWLKSVQQPNGGWGESCRSYDDPEWKGRGETTASQTAWALLGLVAAGEANSPEVQAGIDYLLRTQEPDGRWREEPFTGTGFPKVFYLKYHMYPLYFPLMALARYERAVRGTVLPKTLAKVG
ncbi:MAG: hypothetical protein KatS3mg105_1834 [Gemmatales bacterium]|nr:MAG: hypothetical protein KatS3mg105_1834 [Gemmatales bacterium]